MATSMTSIAIIALFVARFQLAHADIISDITAPETDQSSALQLKAEIFWKPILSAGEDLNMEKHLEVYAEAEIVIKNLPAANEYVRQILREALDHLKRADDAAFQQALSSARLAREKLYAPVDGGSSFSFLHGGQNFLKSALKRFIGGGRYPERLVQHVEQRQADILPALRGAADVSGDILGECRLASKKGFDVRKYDIYNRGVPKTPQAADDMADKIIDAASETRRHFMRSITDLVNGITRDVEGQEEDPAVTVTKASLQTLHQTVANAETRISRTAKKAELIPSNSSFDGPLIIGDDSGCASKDEPVVSEYDSHCSGCSEA